MAFQTRLELYQAAAAQEGLNTQTRSGPILNSDYIGRHAPQIPEAQCKRPAQYPPTERGHFVGLRQLSFISSFSPLCRLLARYGRSVRIYRCPLIGEDRKSVAARQNDAIDPFRNSELLGLTPIRPRTTPRFDIDSHQK